MLSVSKGLRCQGGPAFLPERALHSNGAVLVVPDTPSVALHAVEPCVRRVVEELRKGTTS
jgi:hypothetical protein